MPSNTSDSLTIGRLAHAAGVGVETIRYYQRRGLLPVPESAGTFRQYPLALTARIHFIKRAQDLGFSLDEITELLRLEDGAHRSRYAGSPPTGWRRSRRRSPISSACRRH